MHTRVQSDPWDCLQIAAARALKDNAKDSQVRLLKALYALPQPFQERPDFDALERAVLECVWSEPEALEQLQSFIDDFISRNRLSKQSIT
jgi:hypothetical protein